MKIKENYEVFIYLSVVFALLFFAYYIILSGVPEGMVHEGMKNMTLNDLVFGLFKRI